MILTDKCLKDFLEYLKNYCCEYEESNRGVFLWFGNETDLLHKDCKLFLNALIIEFFDTSELLKGFNLFENIFYREYRSTDFKDRKKATEKAIEKANEIYNAV